MVALPRRTFLNGQLPAVAVYEAVFMGVGAWLAPTARGALDRYTSRAGLLLLLLVFALTGCVLSKRIRATVKRREIIEVQV